MEQNSLSSRTMASDTPLLSIIDSKAYRLGISADYLNALMDFRKMLHAIFIEDNAEARAQYPGIARFRNLNHYKQFYQTSILNKILKTSKNDPRLNALQTLADTTGEIFIIPVKEIVDAQETYNVRQGGLHVRHEYLLPHGSPWKSWLKFYAHDTEFKQDLRMLRILEHIKGHALPPESYSIESRLISTPLVKGDITYLQENVNDVYVVPRDIRLENGRAALEGVIETSLALTGFDRNPDRIPKDIRADVEGFLNDTAVMQRNLIRNRLHPSQPMLKHNLFDALGAEAAKRGITNNLDPDVLEALDEQYARTIVRQLTTGAMYICHGDVFPGNIVEHLDGKIDLIDYTPIRAKLALDLAGVIDHLGLDSADKTVLLDHSAELIRTRAPSFGVELARSRDGQTAPAQVLRTQLEHDYLVASAHRNLVHTSRLLRRGASQGGKSDPNVTYQAALEALSLVGRNSPSYRALTKQLRDAVETEFQGVLKSQAHSHTTSTTDHASAEQSRTHEALRNFFDPRHVPTTEHAPIKGPYKQQTRPEIVTGFYDELMAKQLSAAESGKRASPVIGTGLVDQEEAKALESGGPAYQRRTYRRDYFLGRIFDDLRALDETHPALRRRLWSLVEDPLLRVVKEWTFDRSMRDASRDEFIAGVSRVLEDPVEGPAIVTLQTYLRPTTLTALLRKNADQRPDLAERLESCSTYYPHALFRDKKLKLKDLDEEIADSISQLEIPEDLRQRMSRITDYIEFANTGNCEGMNQYTWRGQYYLPASMLWTIPIGGKTDELRELYDPVNVKRAIYEIMGTILQISRSHVTESGWELFRWNKRSAFRINMPQFSTLMDLALKPYAANQMLNEWQQRPNGPLYRTRLANQIGLELNNVSPETLSIHDYFTDADTTYTPSSKRMNTHGYLPFTVAILNNQLGVAAEIAGQGKS